MPLKMSETKELFPRGLFFILLHDHSGVVTAETERVAESSAHGAMLGLVEGEVEGVINLFVFVALLVVDCGGNNVVDNRQSAEHWHRADDRSSTWSS